MSLFLVAGVNARPVALSAKRLGHQVHAVDYFSDADLRSAVDAVHGVGGQYSLRALYEKTRQVAEELNPDALLLAGELGCNPEYVRGLEEFNLVGNDSERVSRVRDWPIFFKKLDALGVKHPKTYQVVNAGELELACSEIGFPLVTKPVHGSAGAGVKLVENSSAAREALMRHGRLLVQEYIEGVAASVSVLGDGGSAKALTLNEQLLGLKELSCRARFQYCGNVVPLESGLRSECLRAAEAVASEFRLKGSAGVDLVIADEPYVVEVNPRFCDTLEGVEKKLKLNLVYMHVKSSEGWLPGKVHQKAGFHAKGILYADRSLTVQGDLSRLGGVVDVPEPGSRFTSGSPVCSVLASGVSRQAALAAVSEKLAEVRKLLR